MEKQYAYDLAPYLTKRAQLSFQNVYSNDGLGLTVRTLQYNIRLLQRKRGLYCQLGLYHQYTLYCREYIILLLLGFQGVVATIMCSIRDCDSPIVMHMDAM
jgi:hypothetical protein